MGGVLFLLHPGIAALVISNIAVIHPLCLPVCKELFRQMDHSRKLQCPVDFVLPLRFEERAQRVKQLRRFVVFPRALQEGKQLSYELGIYAPQESAQ